MQDIVQAIANHLNLATLSGPIWKISENVGSNDDIATHATLIAMTNMGLIEKVDTVGNQSFRKKAMVASIDRHAVERIAGRVQATYDRLMAA